MCVCKNIPKGIDKSRNKHDFFLFPAIPGIKLNFPGKVLLLLLSMTTDAYSVTLLPFLGALLSTVVIQSTFFFISYLLFERLVLVKGDSLI